MDTVDGRHARRERNKDAVIEAALELLQDGHYTPSAQEIADRAGVSLRSVFRYHDSLDGLLAAAGQEYMSRHADLLVYAPRPDDRRPLEERIDDYVEHAARFYEQCQGFARVANRRAYTDAQYGELVLRNRRTTAEVIAAAFATELAALSPARQRAAIADVHTAALFSVWDNLVGLHGLTIEEASAVTRERVMAALSPVSASTSRS